MGLQADKSVLTAQLNLHTRDLRLLDPVLTQIHPSAILCRSDPASFCRNLFACSSIQALSTLFQWRPWRAADIGTYCALLAVIVLYSDSVP